MDMRYGRKRKVNDDPGDFCLLSKYKWGKKTDMFKKKMDYHVKEKIE